MANYTLSTELHAPGHGVTPQGLQLRVTSRCDETAFLSEGDECDLVSDDVRSMVQLVIVVIIVPIINLFGTGANIINMVCFVKQGVRDPVNIAFIGLTMSELLSMVTSIWNSFCLNPLLYESESAIWSPYMAFMTGSVPHMACTRVTCCMTAFITLKRCLCVLLPLKVQLIFSAIRVSVIAITIHIVTLTTNLAPVYYTTRIAMVPHPSNPNRTWLGIVYTKDQPIVQKYSNAINSGLIPFSTFTIICVSTAVMVKALMRKTNWRKTTTAPGNYNSVSSRDRSVSGMVVLIAVMFIICYTPVCLIFLGMMVVPKFSALGHYRNLVRLLISCAYILESCNASFNIFVYYNMSSRYRQTFRQGMCFLRMTDDTTHKR